MLRAADIRARQTKVNRSALIRDALRLHLRNLERKKLEMRDREGYGAHPMKASTLGPNSIHQRSGSLVEKPGDTAGVVGGDLRRVL